MITPDKLELNNVYFLVSQERPPNNIPVINTLIYLGKNILNNDEKIEESYIFQEACSFYKGCKHQKLSERKLIYADSSIVLSMFDTDDLIESLEDLRDGRYL